MHGNHLKSLKCSINIMSVEIIAAYIVFAFVGGGRRPGRTTSCLLASGDDAPVPGKRCQFVFGYQSRFRGRCSGLSAPDSVSFFLRVPEAQIALKILGTA